MIKIFRKIRQKLLSENPPKKTSRAGKLSRYLIYSIGEIVLVVIGILIALQINNANENRKERVIEKELIVELHTTVMANQENLERGLERWQSTTEALNLIKHVIEQKLPYADSLARFFSEAHRKRGNNLNSLNFSGYKSLENRGYYLIRNKELRKAIIYLFEHRLASLAATNIQVDIDNSSFQYEYIARNFAINFDSEIPIDYGKVMNDPFYSSILSSFETSMGRKINRVYRFLQDNQIVLDLLEDELARLD